jgi:hypothetical protein
VDGRKGYLVPLAVLGALFRGKMLSALTQAYARGELDLGGCASELRDPLVFARLRDALYKMRWIVYVKRPFASPGGPRSRASRPERPRGEVPRDERARLVYSAARCRRRASEASRRSRDGSRGTW